MSVPLRTVLLHEKRRGLDLELMASRLTTLNRKVSKSEEPVTADDLRSIIASPEIVLLFLQVVGREFRPGVVVGMVQLTQHVLARTAHLDQLVVITSGAQRGHGTPLLSDAVTAVWRRWPKVDRIDLTTSNTRLIPWYQARGFQLRVTTPARMQRPPEK